MNDPGTDILSIVYAHDIPQEFPEKVLNQAERVASEVSEADRAGRLDLRSWQMVTIDGEDAKDLDDAVSLTKEGESVASGRPHRRREQLCRRKTVPLDREALKRGTSVYLADRVIPMLPHRLSNGICSLNAGEDRLALSCLMDIDEKGTIVSHQIAETVVNIDRRMTLHQRDKEILTESGPRKKQKRYAGICSHVPGQMESLAALLRKKRKARGSIDFDFPEIQDCAG